MDLIQKMHTSVGFDRKYFTCLSVPGQWLWLPRGVALLDGIKNIVDSHLREEGYQRVAIPSIQQLCWQMAEDIEPFDEGVLDKRAEMACASGLSKVCEELAIFVHYPRDIGHHDQFLCVQNFSHLASY